MLIGREKEQRRLLLAEGSDRSEFVAVFGRRRVGKTFLIRETFKDRFCFYHTGLANVGMARQLAEFKKTLCRYGQRKFRTPKDWYDAFDLLAEVVAGNASPKKIVFLDELPWMDTAKSGFVSALEHFWNGWGAGVQQLMLIVCGSATAWISDKKNLRIDDNVWISHNVRLDTTGGVEIGEGCQIGYGASILSHSSHISIRLLGYHYMETDGIRPGYVLKPVKIGKYTFIAGGSYILPGVTIGKGCVIGVNSVVTRDIPDYSIAYGSPAKVVGSTLELDRKFLDENPTLKETYYDVEKTI